MISIKDAQIPAARPLAFVVDDVEGNRVLAAAYLEMLGWQVDSFPDAASAWAALRMGLPQAMLLDMRMPGMSGEQFARLLKADARTSPIRIIGYTAHALADEVARVRAAGVDDVLIKPVLLQDMKKVFCAAA